MPDKPALIAIHGINTKGAWQSTLRPVFAPHFRYHPITYPHYRFLGATKVLLEPWLVALAVVVAAVAVSIGAVDRNARTLVSFGIATVLIAYLGAAIRRRQAFVSVLKQLDAHVRVGELPYAIAHSFGT